MKGAPWENRLVYIRMSFAFVYPIDGHRIVEYTHLIGPSRRLPRVLRGSNFPYFYVLSSFAKFDTRIDRQKRPK